MFKIYLKMSHLVKISKYLLIEIGNSKHFISGKIGNYSQNRENITETPSNHFFRFLWNFLIFSLKLN